MQRRENEKRGSTTVASFCFKFLSVDVWCSFEQQVDSATELAWHAWTKQNMHFLNSFHICMTKVSASDQNWTEMEDTGRKSRQTSHLHFDFFRSDSFHRIWMRRKEKGKIEKTTKPKGNDSEAKYSKRKITESRWNQTTTREKSYCKAKEEKENWFRTEATTGKEKTKTRGDQ